MEMAARVGEKSYERMETAPAVQAVEGAALSAVEFFGEGEAGMLLQFGGSRLEIMSGTHVEAARGTQPIAPCELHQALSSASGSPVRHVRVDRGRAMTIEFAEGLVLRVSLAPEARTGLESAAYYDEAWRYESY